MTGDSHQLGRENAGERDSHVDACQRRIHPREGDAGSVLSAAVGALCAPPPAAAARAHCCCDTPGPPPPRPVCMQPACGAPMPPLTGLARFAPSHSPGPPRGGFPQHCRWAREVRAAPGHCVREPRLIHARTHTHAHQHAHAPGHACGQAGQLAAAWVCRRALLSTNAGRPPPNGTPQGAATTTTTSRLNMRTPTCPRRAGARRTSSACARARRVYGSCNAAMQPS